MNKAKRELRRAYLPKLKKAVPLDPTTGKISTGARKSLDGIGDAVFGDMIRRAEITDGKTLVDPNSDLLGEKKLKLAFRAVPYGYLNEFEGEINLRKTIN